VSTEENKAIIRRFYEEVNKGNLAVVDELIGPNFVLHHPLSPTVIRGPEGFQELLTQLRTALPDLEIAADDLIAEGDKVAAAFTVRGTHQGVLLDIPPTGRQITLRGVAVYRLADGKIVEDRVAEDLLALVRQLGQVPAPKQS
jgi:steroid delta-isomerase-like uncharacterized protein